MSRTTTALVAALLAGCQADNTPLELGGTMIESVELKPRVDPSDDMCNDSNICTGEDRLPASFFNHPNCFISLFVFNVSDNDLCPFFGK